MTPKADNDQSPARSVRDAGGPAGTVVPPSPTADPLSDGGPTPPLAIPSGIEDIELDLDSLRPFDRNARTHPQQQIAELAANLKRNGFTNPIIVDEDGMILSGHGRAEAARVAGFSRVPCRRVSGWSEGQKRAYILWDNKSALKAGWDDVLLLHELTDIKNLGLLADTGFDPSEVELLASGWHPDIDVRDRDGESLNGAAAIVKVSVDRDEQEVARKVITQALEAAGVTFELL